MLANLIREHAAELAQAGKWDAVAAILNAPTVEVRDSTLRTTGWLMQSLTAVIDPATGMTEADLVLGTLQRSTIPRVRAAYDRMSSIGLDLSDPQAQELIPALGAAANWPENLTDRIKSAGVSMWSLAGNPVTAEQCESAYEFARLAQQWSTLQNESINPAVGNRAELIAALKAAIETLEAG